MAKQGMKRFERQHVQPENNLPTVPQIQGKAKTGKEKAKPIPKVYREIDTDLARDNIENDLTFADLQDL